MLLNSVLPESTEVGIVCWRRRTNLNILSPSGRNPSLSAKVTIPSPAGGTKTNRPNIIATVVRNPSLELPTPGPENIEIKKENNFNDFCHRIRIQFTLIKRLSRTKVIFLASHIGKFIIECNISTREFIPSEKATTYEVQTLL